MITPDEEQLAVLGSRAKFNAIDGNAGAAKTTTLAMKLGTSTTMPIACSAGSSKG